ncbi:MAG: prepilin-type N-terminal cleavage/methylation domain-containing protein [Candidatus Kappaea frigidicola]|nr:prepilin-type N-terminal cleavage/methylation domain-containing protein [Candidatus Kappaea frigidicola]
MKRKLKSFTLVELMIVVVIISILISLTLTGIFIGQQQAIETKTMSNLRQCGIAIYSYAKNSGGYCPNNWSDLTTGLNPYLDNSEVTKSGKGDIFNLDCGGRNIYLMFSNDILASDSLGADPSNQAVYCDGRVTLVIAP